MDSFRVDRLAGLSSIANIGNSDRDRCGVARRNREGFLDCYIRLAPADRDLRYLRADGTARIEYVPSETLFREDSATSFQIKPVTLKHPGSRKVTPGNALGLSHGSTGNLLLRENTPYGDFLGIVASVHSKPGIEAVENGWEVSPGYGVSLRKDADGRYAQTDRWGNHVAIVEKARGGEDIAPVLEGIHLDSFRSDSAEDEQIEVWRQDGYDEELSRVPFNSDQIFGAFQAYSKGDSGIWTPEAINLDMCGMKGKKKPAHDEEVNDETGEETKPEGSDSNGASFPWEAKKSSKKKKRKQRSDSAGVGFFDYSPTPETTMATIRIGGPNGQDYEVSDSAKAALIPILERADAYDELYAEWESETQRADQAELDLSESYDRIDSLVAAAEINNDSDDDFGPSEAEFAQSVYEGIALVDGIRQDGMLLVDTGKLAEFNTDAGAIMSDLDGLQRSMLKAIVPALSDRIDNWEPAEVSSKYEDHFLQFRADAEERLAQAGPRQDSYEGAPVGEEYYRGRGHAPLISGSDFRSDDALEVEEAEESRNDMKHHYGKKHSYHRGPKLTDIPAVVKPSYTSRESIQALLRKVREEDRKAYDEATIKNKPVTSTSVPTVNLM